MATYTELDEFGFLSITGKDARTFFQGYSTCDVEGLSETQAGLGATCNLQGRMINSFRIVPTDGGLLLRLDKSLLASTRDFLDKYIVFSKAETHDESATWRCFGVIGNDPGTLPEAVNGLVRGEDHCIIRVSDRGPRFEVWARGPLDLFDGMSPACGNEWKQMEIEDGLAWVNAATAEDFIPQMFNYHQLAGVSFEKGCYLGQEIVARMQHRGELKRRLFRGRAPVRIEPGNAIVDASGRQIGTVVSAAEDSEDYSLLAVVQTRALDDQPRLEGGESLALAPAFH